MNVFLTPEPHQEQGDRLHHGATIAREGLIPTSTA